MQIDIQPIEQYDPTLVARIGELLTQLTSREITFTEATLRQIVDSPSSRLFIARVEGEVAGMLTLGIYLAPTGRKIWIEDVVVDSRHRGNGLGHKLVRHAMDYCRRYAPCQIMLTSNPLRAEANRLYRSEGFEQRCTNVYKLDVIGAF